MWTYSSPHATYPTSPRCVIIVRAMGAVKEKKERQMWVLHTALIGMNKEQVVSPET
jgi:hypothetical protein